MKRLLLLFAVLLPVLGLFAENRALVVGIGKYPVYTGWPAIHGDNDVELLIPILSKNGYKDIAALKNSDATKSRIVSELKSLAKRCKPDDKVFFLFSGHGQPVTDLNKDEGAKGFDESIVPYDAYNSITKRKKNGEFYAGENHLIDDELNQLLAEVKKKIGTAGEMFVAFDACYSSDLERAPDDDDAELPPTRGSSQRLVLANRKTPLDNVSKPKDFPQGASMIVASACKSDERNFEYRAPDGKVYGSLAYCIFKLLKQSKDFSYWGQIIGGEDIEKLRIFRPFQHPQVRKYF